MMGYSEVRLILTKKNASSIGCIRWSLDESFPAEKVVLVEHEEKLIELSFGGLDSLFH
jgi:hypothetical protein